MHWSLTTSELLLPQVAQLQAVQVCGKHTHRVVADPHRVAASPEQQPLELTVTEQRLGAEVPGRGGKSRYELCYNPWMQRASAACLQSSRAGLAPHAPWHEITRQRQVLINK